ncbi:MAG TPA: trypsin-like peptidase domain-containing protein [Steroidobacteraceae bacterium]
MFKVPLRYILSLCCSAAVSNSLAANSGDADLVRAAGPSVVTILVEERREDAGQRAVERATARRESDEVAEAIHRLLSGPDTREAPGSDGYAQGSGFVIRGDGLIVTNRHVVVGASTVKVKFLGGQELTAKVIGTDAATDIALLRVPAPAPLPALHLGSTNDVAVGDVAIAIGNPFGLGQSVTAGIVSARGRTLGDDPYIDFLQTDAAINFGNSGGPLLSGDGTVIGVTSAILSPSGGSVGVGFAIPAETVTSVISELEAHGHVDRGYLGISAQPLTPAIARSLGLSSPDGALVTAVAGDGPSKETLHVGDVLLTINSTSVTFESMGHLVGRLKPGSTPQATVMRNGHHEQVLLLIGQLPEPADHPGRTGESDTWVPALEMGIAQTTPDMRAAIKANDESSGLIVTQLRPNGPGALAGLRIGDLITYAGTKHLKDVSELKNVDRPSTRLPLLLRVFHDGAPGFVAVTGSKDQ